MRPVARPLSSRSEAKSSVVSRRPGAQSKGEKTAGSKQVTRENHPFDLQDLKDQVRRLRASQDDIENECDDLETKNTALELELKSLQRERITLGDSVDAKQLVEPLDEGTVKKNAEDGMGIINKDFIEANMKLEVSLLMADIKRILPALEQEALRWERMVNAADKQRFDGNIGGDARIPQLFLKRPEDLKLEVTVSGENICKARSALHVMEREAIAKMLDMRAQVRQLRDEFDEMVENNATQSIAISDFQRMVAADFVMTDLLCSEFVRLRSEICGQDKGNIVKRLPSSAWAKIAFKAYTEAIGCGPLRYELLGDCLLPWVADDDVLCDRLAERIEEAWQSLRSSGEFGIESDRSPINLVLFERICELVYA